MIFELRERGRQIQLTEHAPSSNIKTLKSMFLIFPECMLQQHRWLRLRNLAVAKLHLMLRQQCDAEEPCSVNTA